MGDITKLGLKKTVLQALCTLKITQSFEVQEKIIPLAIKGKNIVFTSKTGSGKTLAYLLGFIGKINPKLGVQMLVLVPSRELCIQVGKEIRRVCDLLGINVGVLYGGRDIKGDYRTLTKKNHILVATPGRLIVHINEKNIRVGDVKYLIFDEADQMFDHGFDTDCAYIKMRVSNDAQMILASATITPRVNDFIKQEITSFELCQVGDMVPSNIVQEKTYCETLEKNELLHEFFSTRNFKRAMVFCNTKQKSRGIAQFLQHHHINAIAFSSDLDQSERIKYLNLFREGKIQVLVTTDVTARGLHIDKVDMVVNYDVPTKHEFYVHRIGRSGRVDKKGYSLTLICPQDVDRFNNIEWLYSLDIKERNVRK